MRLPRVRFTVRRLLGALALIATICGAVAWFARVVYVARRDAESGACRGHLKQIARAVYNYHDAYWSFPPAYLTDARGAPTLSWRVLILPFLGDDELYKSFDLSEPWDGPTNIKLLPRMPKELSCPSHDRDIESGRTKWAAVTGPGTMFPGATTTNFADVKDGLDGTIMLAEVANLDVPWTAPVDLDLRTTSLVINDPGKPGLSSPHAGGPMVSLAGGSVSRVPRSISPGALRALLTIDGGER
jgi:hypothetical protein